MIEISNIHFQAIRGMITVYVDILAPLYWWKEFDMCTARTVVNSSSTTYEIHEKEFTIEDFSFEHTNDLKELIPEDWCKRLNDYGNDVLSAVAIHDGLVHIQNDIIETLNQFRDLYLQTKDERYWWQMIQLLPSSYNQKRTVKLNYEDLASIYANHKDSKLAEWREFCEYMNLPYSKLFTGGLSV